MTELVKYVQDLSNGQALFTCIFGAGNYGTQLFRELRSRAIESHFFADNNAVKWGTRIDSLRCLSPDQLQSIKTHTLVIVAIQEPEPIIQQLQSKGYPFIATKQQLDPIIIRTPLMRWATALDEIEEIDYSSRDVKMLTKRFYQTIYEIVRHYEGRMN